MNNKEKELEFEERAYKELLIGAFLFLLGIIIATIASCFNMGNVTAKIIALFETFFMGIGALGIAGSPIHYVFSLASLAKTKQE